MPVLLEPPSIKANKHIIHRLLLNYSPGMSKLTKLTLDDFGKLFTVKFWKIAAWGKKRTKNSHDCIGHYAVHCPLYCTVIDVALKNCQALLMMTFTCICLNSFKFILYNLIFVLIPFNPPLASIILCNSIHFLGRPMSAHSSVQI